MYIACVGCMRVTQCFTCMCICFCARLCVCINGLSYITWIRIFGFNLLCISRVVKSYSKMSLSVSIDGVHVCCRYCMYVPENYFRIVHFLLKSCIVSIKRIIHILCIFFCV